MASIYKNFKTYSKYGTVPSANNTNYLYNVRHHKREYLYSVRDNVPQNSFYKSAHLIDSIVGPLKDFMFGVKPSERDNLGSRKHSYPGLICVPVFVFSIITIMILQPLCLVFAYLSYLPAKGLAKITGNEDLTRNTGSLIDYSNMLLSKAIECGKVVDKFTNKAFSYACAAIIWTAALIITPLVWAVEKVQSKFSDVKEPRDFNDVEEPGNFYGIAESRNFNCHSWNR